MCIALLKRKLPACGLNANSISCWLYNYKPVNTDVFLVIASPSPPENSNDQICICLCRLHVYKSTPILCSRLTFGVWVSYVMNFWLENHLLKLKVIKKRIAEFQG